MTLEDALKASEVSHKLMNDKSEPKAQRKVSVIIIAYKRKQNPTDVNSPHLLNYLHSNKYSFAEEVVASQQLVESDEWEPA